ncbi:MAG: hypothetical protein D6679_09965 [Candidatus Hydrogenedentota bacterium]|nr:MAG: hypothetical protein D6679_09965 [Candidatus Hydrogenedentota bacterium]
MRADIFIRGIQENQIFTSMLVETRDNTWSVPSFFFVFLRAMVQSKSGLLTIRKGRSSMRPLLRLVANH